MRYEPTPAERIAKRLTIKLPLYDKYDVCIAPIAPGAEPFCGVVAEYVEMLRCHNYFNHIIFCGGSIPAEHPMSPTAVKAFHEFTHKPLEGETASTYMKRAIERKGVDVRIDTVDASVSLLENLEGALQIFKDTMDKQKQEGRRPIERLKNDKIIPPRILLAPIFAQQRRVIATCYTAGDKIFTKWKFRRMLMTALPNIFPNKSGIYTLGETNWDASPELVGFADKEHKKVGDNDNSSVFRKSDMTPFRQRDLERRTRDWEKLLKAAA